MSAVKLKNLNLWIFIITLVLLNPDIPCLWKQFRSRLVGFCRSQLIRICTVCNVVVWVFNATRHPRHIVAEAIVMYTYFYSLAVMDHPCTLGAAVYHQAPPCPLYTHPRACRVWARHANGLKTVSTQVGFESKISTQSTTVCRYIVCESISTTLIK